MGLGIRKEQLGPNHVNVAMSYNNLGEVYSDTGMVVTQVPMKD